VDLQLLPLQGPRGPLSPLGPAAWGLGQTWGSDVEDRRLHASTSSVLDHPFDPLIASQWTEYAYPHRIEVSLHYQLTLSQVNQREMLEGPPGKEHKAYKSQFGPK
jgi:hypothetical protein